MKTILSILSLGLIMNVSSAQVLKTLGDRAKQKLESRAGDKMDKTIDDAIDGEKKTPGDKDIASNEDATISENSTTTDSKSAAPETMKAYSKYDFVQGEKLIAFEDFSDAAIGDFPARWNTNGSAEIVSINKRQGKWLKINNGGYFFPEFISNIPDNSTLEFDLGVNNDFRWANSTFDIYLTHLQDREDFTNQNNDHRLVMLMHPMTGKDSKGGVQFSSEYGPTTIANSANATRWDNTQNLFAHVSIWRQGTRLRMYVNGEKMFDLPKAFVQGNSYNAVLFNVSHLSDGDENYYLLSNVRMAEGAPDTRNKLITEGKFVTTGITFDVNSDKLKAESYGVLKEIATALNENNGVKIKIIGHTDNDGSDAANLDLSKRRAAAVKAALTEEFKIDASRMETDGKGESTPVAENSTAAGKAQNRRVEFIKL